MSRRDTHAAIRKNGGGDQLDRLCHLLNGHANKLERVVALADEAHGVTGADATILRRLGDRARRLLAAIEATFDRPVIAPPYGDLGRWGDNGHGPMIDDLVSSAEFHARTALRRRAA